MIKYFVIIPFFIFSSIHCQTFNISGVISDSSSGDFLISGNLFIQELQKGTISNSYGYYSVSIPKNQYSIIFSYVGYYNKEVIIDLTNDTILNICLVPETEKIDEVVVISKSSRHQMLDSRMGMIYLPIKKIETIPMILGENDVIKTLQTLPGVQSGTEGSSGLYVRGGGPDQNQILLDGIPVYYINHLYGFLSVFNNDAIKNVSISKGSFPAQYGGRLSSVIDINMKEGNINKLAGKGSIGLVASKLLLEVPLFKKQEKTSFMISGRRTYLDAFTIPLQK